MLRRGRMDLYVNLRLIAALSSGLLVRSRNLAGAVTIL